MRIDRDRDYVTEHDVCSETYLCPLEEFDGLLLLLQGLLRGREDLTHLGDLGPEVGALALLALQLAAEGIQLLSRKVNLLVEGACVPWNRNWDE